MVIILDVLVLAQYFPPDMGGGSARVSNVVNGLLKKGCHVTVIAAFPHYPHGNVPDHYKFKAIVPEWYGQAKVYRVWIPALAHSTALKRIVLHLSFVFSSLFALPFVGRADVVWVSNPNLFGFIPGLVYGLVKHVPIVRNVDDLWPEVFYELGYVKSKSAKKILNLFAQLSYVVPAAITPISEGYKKHIITVYGVDSKKISVVEVGVDPVKPLLNKQSCQEKNLFTVMYSGVLGLGYDFDIIFRAAKLLSEYPSIQFVIRGVGELAPKLKNMVHVLGLKNVVVTDNFLSKDELTVLLGSADVFVLPMAKMNFVDSGLPTKVFEYQAYGKPIICVSDGEAARYIQATNSGLIVKHDDVTGFVYSVLKLYSDVALRCELGQKGRQYVAENLTSKCVGERIYALFKSILQNGC